ncbi:MFS transporter [Orrella daihaiensis]|uniref:MFS transporter n=2 Tax=Orrella daihaiensis TaxID=2782176 RepID=A0ABY4APF6_9BURK|nr:MFS transporter [Orrella daihaiensis]
MVNVALPTIAKALQTDAATVIWVVNAYGLTVAVTLLPFASLAERIGFKRVFGSGLLVFTLGALASAMAPNIGLLVSARIVQGLGAAAIMCLFGGLMRHVYPQKLLAKGIAINAMSVAVNSVIGPTIGSTILSFANWRWMFVALMPLVIVTAFAMRHLPDVTTVTSRFDYKAAALSAITIGLFILGLDYLAAYTFYALLCMMASILLGAWLVRSCAGQTSPLVPIDLFRIAAIRSALGASVCSFAAQMATFVSLPFYLQTVYGHDPMTVGWLMASWPLGAAIMAIAAARLAERVDVAILCAIGASAMALASLLIVLLPTSAHIGWLMSAMMLGGLGFGFFQTPNNRALLSSAPRERAGAIGGLQAVTRVFGQTSGAALVASAFAASQLWGSTIGLIISMCFALVALLVNIRRYRQDRERGVRGASVTP